MAKNSKKKTESQIRAERVANANKARETMIANAIAEYEASKQVQTQRQSALNAEKIDSQSQHKQESTQPVVTQVVQQPANAQNTASVNQFFVKRTLDSSKKAKTCGIVSFVINGIILLAGFALALIVFLSFYQNINNNDSLQSWETIIGKLVNDWTTADWSNVYGQWLSVNNMMWYMTLGSVGCVVLGSIIATALSITILVNNTTVKNNLLSTNQGQQAKLGSFKALNAFAILQIVIGIGAILSYVANVIVWYQGLAIFTPIIQIVISGIALAIFVFGIFVIAFACKQNALVNKLAKGQLSMLVGAVEGTTLVEDEVQTVEEQKELTEREKIIAKYAALRAEVEKNRDARISKVHATDDIWLRIYNNKLEYYEKEDPKRATKLVNSKNKHDAKLAAKQDKIEEKANIKINELNEAEKAELAALDQREKAEQARLDAIKQAKKGQEDLKQSRIYSRALYKKLKLLRKEQARIAREKSLGILAYNKSRAQSAYYDAKARLETEVYYDVADDDSSMLVDWPAIRQAKKDSRLLSKKQNKQSKIDREYSRKESKLSYDTKLEKELSKEQAKKDLQKQTKKAAAEKTKQEKKNAKEKVKQDKLAAKEKAEQEKQVAKEKSADKKAKGDATDQAKAEKLAQKIEEKDSNDNQENK